MVGRKPRELLIAHRTFLERSMEQVKCDGMKVEPTIANSIPLVTITVLLQHISSHFAVPTRTLMVHLHFIVRGRTLVRVFSVRYSTF